MHDLKHGSPLWYVFTMNATTNTPHPPCPDALVAEAEVDPKVVAVARPIPLTSTPSPLPLGSAFCQSMMAFQISTHHHCLSRRHPLTPHCRHRTYPFAAVLCQSSWAASPGWKRSPPPLLLCYGSCHLSRHQGNHSCWCAVTIPLLVALPHIAVAYAMIAIIVVIVDSRPPHGILPAIRSSWKIQRQKWDCHQNQGEETTPASSDYTCCQFILVSCCSCRGMEEELALASSPVAWDRSHIETTETTSCSVFVTCQGGRCGVMVWFWRLACLLVALDHCVAIVVCKKACLYTFGRGRIEFLGQNFFQNIPFVMIVICWYIGEIE